MALLVGLLFPRELVFCRTGDGHAELEEAALACCLTSDPGMRCTGASLFAGRPARDAAFGSPDEACTDVLIGTPSRPGTKTSFALHLLPAPPEPLPALAAPAKPAAAAERRSVARELDPSTLLRV